MIQRRLIAAALIALTTPTVALAAPEAASDSTAAPEIPAALRDRMEELQDLVDRHESQLTQQGTLTQQLDRALAPAISGSVGARYQFISTFAAPPTANLPQARLRLSVHSRQPGPLQYEVRVVTGATDLPNQSWVPFGAFFGKTPVALDRYSIGWRPLDPLQITVGKFADPYANSELLWDDDVQPQGLNETLSFDQWLPKTVSATANLGQLVMAANGSDSGSYALAGKMALSTRATNWLKLDAAASYLSFINPSAMITPGTLGARPALVTRNRLDASGTRLLNNFNLVNLFGRASFDVWPNVPIRLTVDHLLNVGAPDQNHGWRMSAFLGSVKDPGSLMAVYRYKYVEADAGLSPLAEDIVGGTDVYAHEVSLTSRLLPKTFAEGTVQVMNRLTMAGPPIWTFRLALLQEF